MILRIFCMFIRENVDMIKARLRTMALSFLFDGKDPMIELQSVHDIVHEQIEQIKSRLQEQTTTDDLDRESISSSLKSIGLALNSHQNILSQMMGEKYMATMAAAKVFEMPAIKQPGDPVNKAN